MRQPTLNGLLNTTKGNEKTGLTINRLINDFGKIIAVEQKNDLNEFDRPAISESKNTISEEVSVQSKVEDDSIKPKLEGKKKSLSSGDNRDSKIEKIVFFYKSGEFEAFNPNND